MSDPKQAVVLVNVGTPAEATVPAVRRFLAEFLGDPLVIDLPGWQRWLLLNLIILPFRPPRTARAYQTVWTSKGSPLLLHSEQQKEALQERTGASVHLAMRYGEPSLSKLLERLSAEGVERVALVPMFPQYAMATSGSVVRAAIAELARRPPMPQVRVAPPLFELEGFIEACAENLQKTLEGFDAEHVLFTYHGLPVRQLKGACTGCDGAKGASTPCPPLSADNAHCYRAQCFATTAAVARRAPARPHSTGFQSRLKGTAWLAPHTDERLLELARSGLKRVAVFSGSFAADCLETLEELGHRGRAAFKAAGGEELKLVPAVNASPRFIDALAQWVGAEEKRN